MIVKIHKRKEKTIVAVCDSNLIGKKFEEGDRQLDLASDFYAGEEREYKEVGDIIRNADIINLVGENAVKIGLQEELITKDHILVIDGIPHAQAVVMHD